MAFLREDLTRDPATRGIRRESKTVGPIGKTVEFDGRAPERRLLDAVLTLVRPYLAEAPNANSVKIAVRCRSLTPAWLLCTRVLVSLFASCCTAAPMQLTADQATAAATDLLEAVLAVTCVRGGEHNG